MTTDISFMHTLGKRAMDEGLITSTGIGQESAYLLTVDIIVPGEERAVFRFRAGKDRMIAFLSGLLIGGGCWDMLLDGSNRLAEEV